VRPRGSAGAGARGIRNGSPAGPTRGFKQAEFEQVADWIADVLDSNGAEAAMDRTRAAVSELCRRYPVYGP
jgi:glycine hydroxymethyltransferase